MIYDDHNSITPSQWTRLLGSWGRDSRLGSSPVTAWFLAKTTPDDPPWLLHILILNPRTPLTLIRNRILKGTFCLLSVSSDPPSYATTFHCPITFAPPSPHYCASNLIHGFICFLSHTNPSQSPFLSWFQFLYPSLALISQCECLNVISWCLITHLESGKITL